MEGTQFWLATINFPGLNIKRRWQSSSTIAGRLINGSSMSWFKTLSVVDFLMFPADVFTNYIAVKGVLNLHLMAEC